MSKGSKAKDQSRLGRFMPIVDWLPAYDRSWLRGDLLAGISVWALAVPTALGYASISGVPVQYGLYASAIGLAGYAIFTTSRHVTAGPGSSTSAVLGAGVLAVAASGSDEAVVLAASIVFVAGLLFLAMYLFKMGWISDFLSAAVLTGFTFGVAFNVAAGQIFKITGTEKAGDNTWQKLWQWILSIPDANTATVVVGVIALAITFGLKFVAPRVPAALIAVAFGIAATKIFDLADRGVELIGDVPRGMPNITLPSAQFIFDNWTTIIGTAIGLVLVGFSVSTAAVRNFATKHDYRISIDQELFALGMSNVMSSFFQGIFGNGSLSRSPVADENGARTQLYNLIQSALVILTLLFLAPLFSSLPDAVLGAVVIEAVVMGMMDVPEMTRLLHVKPVEFWTAIAALLGVMTFGTLWGVLIGAILSIIWLVAISSNPQIPELGRKPGTQAFYDIANHPDGETYPGLLILRFDGGLFFVSAGSLGDRIREARIEADEELSGVIISMEGVNFIDTEGADLLRKIALAGIEKNVDVHLARVKPEIIEVMERDGVIEALGPGHIHPDIASAVDMHLAKHTRS